ncbi:MAG: hypothetical protein OXR64_12985 [Chloroflexota bacterium]|nr:hypothetical protein [Chloroflexota bacterium]MDE2920743.1 hypothetical protein [Chloroflexota bacterium]
MDAAPGHVEGIVDLSLGLRLAAGHQGCGEVERILVAVDEMAEGSTVASLAALDGLCFSQWRSCAPFT